MIAKEQALLFEEEIKLNLNDYENTHIYRTLKAYSIFKQIIDVTIAEEKFYFSGFLAKRLFIYNKYNLPQDLIDKINSYCKFINNLNRNPKLYCSKDDMESSFRFALKILQIVTNEINDIELEKFLTEEPILSYTDNSNDNAESFTLVVTKKSNDDNEHKIIFGESEEQGKIAIYLNRMWGSIWVYVLPYSTISVQNVEKQYTKKGYNVYYCNQNTFLVYENDFLIDVTEVAGCFQNIGQSEYFALLKWLSISYPSTPMLIGNIVNSLFDALICNEEIDIERFIDNELTKSPLLYFYLDKYDFQKIGNIKNEVELIYNKLKNTINDIPKGQTFIEPSFICPQYGLQGRLDALVIDENDNNKKEVIELKSGKFPSTSIPIRTSNGIVYTLTTWRNNYIQASCYNLILESVYEGRYGNSSIYYAKDDKRPFRNAPILAGNYQEIIDLRNRIVGLYFCIANNNFSSFNKLLVELSGFPQSYWKEDVERYESKLKNSTSLAKEYLKVILSFIFRELISNKVGKYAETTENSYSNLWLNENKSGSRKVLYNLVLNKKESDYETFYLRFDRTDENEANFRIGDQILVYPISNEGISLLLNEQLLKGVIKQINSNYVLVSLRNKLLGTNFLYQYDFWAIEGDFLEHSYKKLPANIFEFVDDNEFDVKIGIEEQKINDVQFECDYLNTKQTEIVKSAISTENYYFIQGPPGTGKTSFVLRALVEYYHSHSEGNILLTAYTNRAVDQICTVLKEKTDIEFIRLGSKESSEHTDVLLSEISSDYSLNELKEKFNNTRVVVLTVSSLLSHQEIFTLKDFEIAIVDEAAQILEPYVVNIINKSKKFIMIGDEKQLPAIVSQSSSNYLIENETLESISMSDLSMSYFQRMIINAEKQGWNHSYGMLTHQGRMSYEIMQIANELFYDMKLLSFSDEIIDNKESINFHNVSAEDKAFINYAEAEYIVNKIKELHSNEETKDMEIGVISPFRSQCALIRNMLTYELIEKVAIDTVERFQGSERDIIFISYAVNKPHHLFNISSIIQIENQVIDRKLNVAITRAKKRLYVTGCKEILDKSEIHKKFISILLKEN